MTLQEPCLQQRSSAQRVRVFRERQRRHEIVAPVVVDRVAVRALIARGLLSEDKSIDRVAVGQAIAECLQQFRDQEK
jgi:hypothetical protein